MKTYRVLFTEHADADFDGISDFIAEDNPRRALSFVTELQEQSVTFLSTTPNAGTRVGDERFAVFGRYIAVYHVDDEERIVTVMIVSEGHRDWQTLLKDRT
jgi:plasmid stabilization system protein ParE